MSGRIINDISQIDKGLFDLQTFKNDIENFEKYCISTIKKMQQDAENQYMDSIHNIEQLEQQANTDCANQLAAISSKRSEIEANYREIIEAQKKEIRKKYDFKLHWDEHYLRETERLLSQIPKKNIEKVTKTTPISACNREYSDISSLFRKIEDGSITATLNRTFQKNGYLSKGKMIEDFVIAAISYILFLKNEIAESEARKNNEIHEMEQRLLRNKQGELKRLDDQSKTCRDKKDNSQKRYTQLRKDALDEKNRRLKLAEQKKPQLAQELQSKKQDFTKKYNKYMQSDLVVKFMERVNRSLVKTGAIDTDWSDWSSEDDFDCFTIGMAVYPLKTQDRFLVGDLQSKLPKKAFQNSAFRVPFLIDAKRSVLVYAHYQGVEKNKYFDFAQNFVLQKLRTSQIRGVDFYLAEPDKSGKLLGVLSAPIDRNEEIGIYNINSKDQIRETLKKFASEIDQINGLLGSAKDIYEYNQSHNNRLREKVFVFSDVVGIMEKDDWDLLRIVWNNARRCGISILFITEYLPHQIPPRYPYAKIDVSFMLQKDICYLHSQSNRITLEYGSEKREFFTPSIRGIKTDFLNTFREAVKANNVVDSSFKKHFDSMKAYPYKDGTYELQLPILLRNYAGGGIYNFILDSSTRTHTIITGNSGAGKTTFLYMLISSIVMNYHPDDAEIWLVDYSKVSFNKYIEKRPPHVRFVATEKTEEFTYSFLEYVRWFFNEREKEFQKYNVDNIIDYRAATNDPYSMPRVVLIIDEFHVMAQQSRDSMEHAKILENIVREYRKYGLHCVFCDQTFNMGGLKDEAILQINNRIAMRQPNAKIIMETLSGERDNFTQEMISQMERTDQGELWTKEFEEGSSSKFHFGFFKGIYAKNDDLQNILDTSIGRNDAVKCDTQVYIIDGDGRKTLGIDQYKEKVEKTRKHKVDICLGTPTTIEPLFCMGIDQKLGNNILVAGTSETLDGAVIQEIILSSSISGSDVFVFADQGNDLYQKMRLALRFWSRKISINLFPDYNEICSNVSKIIEKVQHKETMQKPVMLLWLGLTDIFEEFSTYPSKKDVREEDDDLITSDKRVEIDEQEFYSDPENIAWAEREGITVEALLKRISESDDDKDLDFSEDFEEFSAYNANADIIELFKLGGRYGVFNTIALEHESEIKRVKGLDLDNFIHKIGFACSRDAAGEFRLGPKAVQIPDENTALYTNGRTSGFFRPFILK